MIQFNPDSERPSINAQALLNDLRKQCSEIRRMGTCIDQLAESIDSAMRDNAMLHAPQDTGRSDNVTAGQTHE